MSAPPIRVGSPFGDPASCPAICYWPPSWAGSSSRQPRVADAFDLYINSVLEKVPAAAGAKEIKQLTPEMILDNNRIIPDVAERMLVVQTNEGRLAKVLVQAARKRLNDENKTQVEILLIERYVTYKAGTERAVVVEGKNVYLFDGFQFSLDLGQVVPATLTPDLRFVAKEKGDKEKGDKSEIHLETVGNAKMWLPTKPLPEAEPPKKGEKFVIGDVFEAKYFGGKYKLYDDGRAPAPWSWRWTRKATSAATSSPTRTASGTRFPARSCSPSTRSSLP